MHEMTGTPFSVSRLFVLSRPGVERMPRARVHHNRGSPRPEEFRYVEEISGIGADP